MAAYSDYEQVWLIKSTGTILGPYSLVELIQGIQDRRISILDEVRSPTTRWGFIREHPQLSEIVKVIRDQDSERGQSTGVTYTGVGSDLTRSVTHEAMSRDDLTPTPIIPESQNQSSVEIKAFERRITNIDQTRVPQPLPKGPAFQETKNNKSLLKDRTNYFLFGGIGLVLLVIVFIISRGQGPKTMNTDEVIKLGQIHRSMGFYDKALIHFHRAYEMKKNDAQLLLHMIPLELVFNKQPLTIQRMIEEVEKNKPVAQSSKTELGNWRGMLFMQQGEYNAAEAEFASLLVSDPMNKKLLLNRAMNLYFLNHFEQSFALLTEAQKVGLAHPFATIIKALDSVHLPAEAVSVDQSNIIRTEIQRWYQFRQEFRAELSLILAIYHHRFGRTAEAMAAMSDLLNIHPDIAKDFIPDLDISYQIITWDRLYPYCERLSDAFKDHSSAKGVLAYCQYKRGDLVGALKQIDLARKQNAGDGLLGGLHAYLLIQAQRLSEAKAVLQMETQGVSQLSQYIRASICFDEKNLSCSIAAINELVSRKTDHVEVMTLLAKVYREKSQKELARQEAERSMALAGNFRPLIELREELNVH